MFLIFRYGFVSAWELCYVLTEMYSSSIFHLTECDVY